MRARRSVMLAVMAGVVGLLAAPALAGVEYKIDMGNGVSPAPVWGWVHVAGANGSRFDKPKTDPSSPEDLGGGARAGFLNYGTDTSRNDRVIPGTYPDPWPNVLDDFSSMNNYGAAGRFVFWNIPEGDYEVTFYMRDEDWGVSTYYAVAHDSTTFTVVDADFVAGDLSTLCDTHQVSTVMFDPDTGGRTYYEEAPSLYFDPGRDGAGAPIPNAVLAIVVTQIEPEMANVPEPGTLALLALGGLGALVRRRRKGSTMRTRMRLLSFLLVAGVAGLLAAPALAGVEVVIENFDNCTAGSYSAYGGVDLGTGSGWLPGWEVGGRYFVITDRDGLGDLDCQSDGQGYGNVAIGTDVQNDGSSRRQPVFELAEALDMSASTYVKITMSNHRAAPLMPAQGSSTDPGIFMYFYDTSAAATTAVKIGTLGSFGWPIPVGTVSYTVLLDSLAPVFNKEEDLVYGFQTSLLGYRTDPGGLDTPIYTWDSAAYDVPEAQPVPEPGTLALLALGGLVLIRRRRS